MHMHLLKEKGNMLFVESPSSSYTETVADGRKGRRASYVKEKEHRGLLLFRIATHMPASSAHQISEAPDITTTPGSIRVWLHGHLPHSTGPVCILRPERYTQYTACNTCPFSSIETVKRYKPWEGRYQQFDTSLRLLDFFPRADASTPSSHSPLFFVFLFVQWWKTHALLSQFSIPTWFHFFLFFPEILHKRVYSANPAASRYIWIFKVFFFCFFFFKGK